MEGRIKRIIKEVMVCVEAVIRKRDLLVQFKYYQKIEMSTSLMLYVCFKKEIGQEVYETIYDGVNTKMSTLL